MKNPNKFTLSHIEGFFDYSIQDGNYQKLSFPSKMEALIAARKLVIEKFLKPRLVHYAAEPRFYPFPEPYYRFDVCITETGNPKTHVHVMDVMVSEMRD